MDTIREYWRDNLSTVNVMYVVVCWVRSIWWIIVKKKKRRTEYPIAEDVKYTEATFIAENQSPLNLWNIFTTVETHRDYFRRLARKTCAVSRDLKVIQFVWNSYNSWWSPFLLFGLFELSKRKLLMAGPVCTVDRHEITSVCWCRQRIDEAHGRGGRAGNARRGYYNNAMAFVLF